MSPAKIEVAATITDEAFQELIAKRGRALLGLANCIVQHKSTSRMLVRPFLGELLSQSMQMSELLDAYGAQTIADGVLSARLLQQLNFFPM